MVEGTIYPSLLDSPNYIYCTKRIIALYLFLKCDLVFDDKLICHPSSWLLNKYQPQLGLHPSLFMSS
jgi:hypothetical protein